MASVLFVIGFGIRQSLSGIGLSGELEQGWAQLLFLVGFAFPSLARRLPSLSAPERVLCSRSLTYAFAAAYTAFLFTTALQGALQAGLAPLSTLIFPAVNAVILAMLIITIRADEYEHLRGRVGRTLFALALAYFWFFFAVLDYAKIGRSRLSDPFFTFAFALLVAGLVLRMSDQWRGRRRLAGKVG